MTRRIAFLVLIPAVALGQYDRPGSTDAQFLKIGVSARGTGLADAYIALAQGAEGTYYNVAAIPWTSGTDVVFVHNEWFAGINHEFAAVTMSFGDVGTFGLSVTGLYTDEMLVRTPLQPEGTGETFYAGNYRFGLSYARYLTDRVTVGATVSYISMTLYEGFSADAMSADIAAYYVSDFRGFRFGMQISHFGSEVKYVNESYPLPTNFTFGVAINAVEADAHKVIVALAALKPNEGPPLAQGGLEWNFNDMFFLRGGYKFNHSVADYALGGGAAALILGLQARVDYSYSHYDLLGASHRFGLGLTF